MWPRAISRLRAIGLASHQERNRPPAVLVARKSSPDWKNRSHRRRGKYGARRCSPPIDGQTPAIIRLQARCRKIQGSCGSLLLGQNSTNFETNRLPNSRNMTTRRGGPTAISSSSSRRWSPTLCQFFLRPLNHDAPFVLSLLQNHG